MQFALTSLKYFNFITILVLFFKFGERLIISEEDTQQSDLLGPLMFCVTIHHMLKSLNSVFISYMDDITLGNPRDVVASDASSTITEGINIGLYLNTDISELIYQTATPLNSSLIDQFAHFTVNDALLLGSHLVIETAMDAVLNKKPSELQLAARSTYFVM